MPDRSRRRAGIHRTHGRTRASSIAGRLGVGLKERRLGGDLRQVDVSDRAGVTQSWVSRMERGLGQSASLETWASVAAAVGLQLVAFLEDVPGADRPRDYEHLKRQQLIIETATAGGWRAAPELLIDPGLTRSRAVDVYLERPTGHEAAAVEIWDFFDDVGAAIRGLDGKVAMIARRHAVTETSAGGLTWRVGGLLVVRGTRRNRALVREFGAIFRARFPGSPDAWMAALTDPARPLPSAGALLWTDVAGTRLIASRLRR
jgi:transcriptional regulator with XRE-family HTH domain